MTRAEQPSVGTPGDPRRSGPVARLDRLRPTGRHVAWIAILGIGYLIETFDNTVFGFLVPSIRAEWHLSVGQVGVVTSGVFFGMFLGGIVGGRLIDRFGRKPVLIGASVSYSLTSLLCALAPNFATLFVGRVLTGLGVQAATGAILVFVSEMYPRLHRGKFFTAVLFFGYLGTPASSFTAAAVAPSGMGAWRWVFGIGTIGLVIAAVAAVALPETVRWLSINGREPEADAIVDHLEHLDKRRGPLEPVVPVPVEIKRGTLRQLFTRTYSQRLVVVTITFAGALYCQYGIMSYLPTILVGRGMPITEALNTASIITLGTLLATPALLLVADRVERKTAVLLEAVILALSLTIFGFAPNRTILIASGFVVYIALAALITSLYSYVPEIFPTEIRGVGTGVVNGVGRLAGVVAALTVVAIFTGLGLPALAIILAAIAVISGLLVATLGPGTTGRSLETID